MSAEVAMDRVRQREGRRLTLFVALLVVGCGGSSSSKDVGRDGSAMSDGPVVIDGTSDSGGEVTADGNAAANCGTFEQNNCPTGSYCYGASACGSVWSCQPQRPDGCTAGLMGMFCGCDGRVVGSTGCPLRYAYPLGSQFSPSTTGLNGAPCDPARAERGPFDLSYQVRGTGFGAFEGKVVRWRFLLPPAEAALLPALAAVHQRTVASAQIDWTLKPDGPALNDQGQPLRRDHTLRFFVDVDGDGACTPGTDRGGAPQALQVDLVAATLAYVLAPPGPGDTGVCAHFP